MYTDFEEAWGRKDGSGNVLINDSREQYRDGVTVVPTNEVVHSEGVVPLRTEENIVPMRPRSPVVTRQLDSTDTTNRSIYLDSDFTFPSELISRKERINDPVIFQKGANNFIRKRDEAGTI